MSEQKIPCYIRERILQSPNSRFVSQTQLPVIADGDPAGACVAIVSLNPRRGKPRGDYLPLNTGGAEKLWEDQKRYFDGGVHIRRRPSDWFDRFLPILHACCACFYARVENCPCAAGHEDIKRLACHLDLVKWPTPKWGDIPRAERMDLLRTDVPFFARQLRESPSVKLVLANGKTAIRGLEQIPGTEIRLRGNILGSRHDLVQGEVLGKPLVGWTGFLSRWQGSAVSKARLATEVGRSADSVCCT